MPIIRRTIQKRRNIDEFLANGDLQVKLNCKSKLKKQFYKET